MSIPLSRHQDLFRQNKYIIQYDSLSSHLTASECILVWSSSIVGNLDSSSLVQSIMVEVEVRALVEAVVNWFCCGRSKISMDIREALYRSVAMVSGIM